MFALPSVKPQARSTAPQGGTSALPRAHSYDQQPTQLFGRDPLAASWEFSQVSAYPPAPPPEVSPRELIVGASDDPLEREADRVSESVVGMPTKGTATTTTAAPPQVSRHLRHKATAAQRGNGDAPAGVHETLRTPGQPLNPESRSFFEPRFGADFSQVRIHADTVAGKSARAVHARAYTVGQHVVFGPGEYAPRTAAGRRLLAHELAHTLQQGGPAGVIRRDPRHDKGYAGEQNMGFGYSQAKGWIFVQGPSGAGGHGITQPGFDGIAYNIATDELHILDNKALKADTARSATALTTNVLKNMDDAIATVTGMQDMPSRIKILGLLTRGRAALAAGTPLPRNLKLVITGEAGNVRRVNSRLAGLGVEFRESGATDTSFAAGSTQAQQTQAAVQTPPPKAQTSVGGTSAPKAAVAPSLEHTDHPALPAAKPNTTTGVDPPDVAGGGKAGTGPTIPAPTSAPRGRFSGVGVQIGAGVLSLGIGVLSAYLKGRVDQRIAARQIDRNQATAQQKLTDMADDAVQMMLTDPDRQLYARVVMTYSVITTIGGDSQSTEPQTNASSPIVDLYAVGYTFDALDPAFADVFWKIGGGAHTPTITRLLTTEIPVETLALEDLIVYAKARKLSLERLHYWALSKFAGIDQKLPPQKFIQDVNHWKHIMELIGPVGPP